MPSYTAPHRNGPCQQDLPDIPHTERQRFSEEGVNELDPYLAGFLAGYAAANSNIDSFPSDNSITALPSMAPMNPILSSLPLVRSTPQSHDIRRTSGASVPLQPQGFESNVQLHEPPAMQPDVLFGTANWGLNGQLLDFDPTTSTASPPSLADSGWVQGSYGATISSASQPPLAIGWDPPLSQKSTPGPNPFQLDRPALSQSQVLVPEVTEGYNAPPPRIATNLDRQRDLVSTHAFTTTEEVEFTQARESFNTSISAPPQANVDDSELFLNALAPGTNRNPKRQKSCVPSVCILPLHVLRLCLHGLQSSSIVTTRVAEGAIQTVFRAYGGKRSRFDEQSRKRTALTRKLGACAVCREKKLRVKSKANRETWRPC